MSLLPLSSCNRAVYAYCICLPFQSELPHLVNRQLLMASIAFTQRSELLNLYEMSKGKVHEKKVKKKLTSVSFAFTHTYTLEKLTLLLFSPSVHGQFWKMCKTQKKKTFHFITLFQEQLKVQYIFEERHRSMKENCLWGRCMKKK